VSESDHNPGSAVLGTEQYSNLKREEVCRWKKSLRNMNKRALRELVERPRSARSRLLVQSLVRDHRTVLAQTYRVDASAMLTVRPCPDLQDKLADIIKQEVETQQEVTVKEEEGIDLGQLLSLEYLTEEEAAKNANKLQGGTTRSGASSVDFHKTSGEGKKNEQKQSSVDSQTEVNVSRNVCKFHQEGRCRYGNRCSDVHLMRLAETRKDVLGFNRDRTADSMDDTEEEQGSGDLVSTSICAAPTSSFATPTPSSATPSFTAGGEARGRKRRRVGGTEIVLGDLVMPPIQEQEVEEGTGGDLRSLRLIHGEEARLLEELSASDRILSEEMDRRRRLMEEVAASDTRLQQEMEKKKKMMDQLVYLGQLKVQRISPSNT